MVGSSTVPGGTELERTKCSMLAARNPRAHYLSDPTRYALSSGTAGGYCAQSAYTGGPESGGLRRERMKPATVNTSQAVWVMNEGRLKSKMSE